MTARVSEKLLVLCGSYREFEMWCAESMVSKNNAIYVSDMEKIRGIMVRPFQVIRYGTWQNVRGLYEIDAYLKFVFDLAGRETHEARQVREGTGTPSRPAGKRAPKPSESK
jgi:hypothetical protein